METAFVPFQIGHFQAPTCNDYNHKSVPASGAVSRCQPLSAARVDF
jgi:hypothetical protein